MSRFKEFLTRLSAIVLRSEIKAISQGSSYMTAEVTGVAQEQIKEVPILQQYGLNSSPPIGSHCVALFQNGSRDQGVIIATDSDTYRAKTLETGEVQIYNNSGAAITLGAGGKVTIEAAEVEVKASTSIAFKAPSINFARA